MSLCSVHKDTIMDTQCSVSCNTKKESVPCSRPRSRTQADIIMVCCASTMTNIVTECSAAIYKTLESLTVTDRCGVIRLKGGNT